MTIIQSILRKHSLEYGAIEFTRTQERAGMVQRMNRAGVPQDNASLESYFHSMKAELLQRQVFNDPIETVARIAAYTAFYNNERLHSSLGYQSPKIYENLYA